MQRLEEKMFSSERKKSANLIRSSLKSAMASKFLKKRDSSVTEGQQSSKINLQSLLGNVKKSKADENRSDSKDENSQGSKSEGRASTNTYILGDVDAPVPPVKGTSGNAVARTSANPLEDWEDQRVNNVAGFICGRWGRAGRPPTPRHPHLASQSGGPRRGSGSGCSL